MGVYRWVDTTARCRQRNNPIFQKGVLMLDLKGCVYTPFERLCGQGQGQDDGYGQGQGQVRAGTESDSGSESDSESQWLN